MPLEPLQPLEPLPFGITVTPGPQTRTLAEKEAAYFEARAAYLADHPPVDGEPLLPSWVDLPTMPAVCPPPGP